MSVKRQATKELNHENWDEPYEPEKMGAFKPASMDVLEKRVIRTAKRRSQASGDEVKKSVFSGFGGFNKTQPSSFDFLANLTNGDKNINSPAIKTDTAVTSSLFSSKPTVSSVSGGIFGIPTSSTPSNTTFGKPTSQSQTLFGATNNSTTSTSSSIFTASKADSTVSDSTFKIQSVSSSGDTNNIGISKPTDANSTISTTQVSSTMFGITSANAPNKTLFSTSNNDSPFKIQPATSTYTASNFGITPKPAVANPIETEKKAEEQNKDKKMKYYAKLKGLNESVTEWIKKHVDETPLCILSPIFKDYEKYLKEIQDEFEGSEKEKSTKMADSQIIEKPKVTESIKANILSPTPNATSSLFNTSNSKSLQNNSTADTKGFSFGINPSTSSPNTTAGFSFGTTSAQPSAVTTTATFSFATNTSTTSPNGAAPFSFGIGKPFNFNANILNNQESSGPTKSGNNDVQEDEDAPPKVEFTPITEENSVFDKRCKIFLKKDGNFVDKGVGTLYIKKIEETDKHQLLVRANTTMGNILLNLRLASAIPIQRMGKNNVMIVCIPTPDSKPPPTSILIRVKTSEEADELLETLNKYKT